MVLSRFNTEPLPYHFRKVHAPNILDKHSYSRRNWMTRVHEITIEEVKATPGNQIYLAGQKRIGDDTLGGGFVEGT